ncbi:DUF2235 domain-containing protein [Glaciimonas sp. PAMC28666]|uniref:DUF2235 domain-containing protein n=1 Tax=Glaciimonas sp. PAMC28666 TaxID=2807626 RepID=UPI0019629D81|nr:DUF2235 domain-containing protein [Glaciimonas sp. PAMC28666]QRX81152.1 DUF2235 domain-containing protein [Glaciimonas sp. PAMC28666]
MTKTIIFCADGSWGGATDPTLSTTENQTNNDVTSTGVAQNENVNTLTNVSMLFRRLEGKNTKWSGTEIERSNQPDGSPTQIAKYVDGVGYGEAVGDKVLDGMFGIGVTTRIANGYTYISEHYEAGDRIVLVGFSRGAYTVRALAGLIASEGLLTPELAKENQNASDVSIKYTNALKAWLGYRKKSDTTEISGLLDRVEDLVSYHHLFASTDLLPEAFVSVKEIAAVAVWDTVGAIGMPLYSLNGNKYDLFNFANNSLSTKVTLGLHAVAIDETRKAFTPTFWKEATNVRQRLFAGVHTDIGGGNADHSLSDVPLRWFFEELQSAEVGVLFKPEFPFSYLPEECGDGHKESVEEIKFPDIYEPRVFPSDMALHEAVNLRKNGGEVMAGVTPTFVGPRAAYNPLNLPA